MNTYTVTIFNMVYPEISEKNILELKKQLNGNDQYIMFKTEKEETWINKENIKFITIQKQK